ncbi:hypothetical protein [Actinomadura macra]|uniref:hypothetical protein n=1 Tax=Actinomadura macra TaxID=46164 RepID=UPI000829C554|nr:hypothetical protein [Actinomadura macra]
MEPRVEAVGKALVEVMATDAWPRAFGACAEALAPMGGDEIVERLIETRARVEDAHARGDDEIEARCVAEWLHRLTEILIREPGFASVLQHLLNEVLTPLLAPSERGHYRMIGMTNRVEGHYVFGGDIHGGSIGQSIGRDQVRDS